jgi:hypothetical protein
MKKYFVGAIVGAILVFGWSAVAHMLMHHHDAAYKQVANQDAAMQSLSQFFTEDGQYMIPSHGPDASPEEQQKFMENMNGKPWAMVVYHTKWNNDMGMSMARSFATAFLCVLIFIFLLGKAPGGFGTVFMKGLGLGFLAFLYVWYNQNIWMQLPWEVIQGELIDLLASWGLCGLWLGWWLNRTTPRKY